MPCSPRTSSVFGSRRRRSLPASRRWATCSKRSRRSSRSSRRCRRQVSGAAEAGGWPNRQSSIHAPGSPRMAEADARRKAKHGFVWVTTGFFVITIVGHWGFAWVAYEQEQREHGEPVDVGDYFAETMRDTLENWQSEFLQLIWQVAGLAYLFYIGSPQSREGDERKEEKMDYIIRKLDPENYERLIQEWDTKYPKS